jgi:hypothetical protein
MKFEDTSVYNIYNAILGARNPKNSWDKSDSIFKGFNGKIENTEIGENDLKLAQTLIRAGSEHRKFMRQILVSVTITAPLYWWKEFDTYKVGTVANSTSTMHKLASTPITMDRFELTSVKLCEVGKAFFEELEKMRVKSNEYRKNGEIEKADKWWKALIQLLPESWLQKRTITMTYENVFYMYNQRCVHPHKLTEWSKTFKEWVESLPYAKELLCIPLEKK